MTVGRGARILRALLLAPSAILIVACSPNYRYATTVRVQDPSRVSFRAGGRDVLPEGRAPLEAVDAAGMYSTGPRSSGAYEVKAVRAADGSIALRVETKLPILNGEHHVLMTPSGEIGPLSSRISDVLPAPSFAAPSLPAPGLVLPMCGRLEERTAKGTFVGYTATLGSPCESQMLYGGYLSTPWENVVRLEEHGVPQNRSIAAVLVGAFSVPFGLAGGILLAAGLGSHDAETRATFGGAGGLLLGSFLLIVAAVSPALFASDTSVVMQPPFGH